MKKPNWNSEILHWLFAVTSLLSQFNLETGQSLFSASQTQVLNNCTCLTLFESSLSLVLCCLINSPPWQSVNVVIYLTMLSVDGVVRQQLRFTETHHFDKHSHRTFECRSIQSSARVVSIQSQKADGIYEALDTVISRSRGGVSMQKSLGRCCHLYLDCIC